jgi:uncharacterized protein (TIGR02246 family)
MALEPAGIRIMAERYAQAWSSQSPDDVASFFAEDARLSVNDGEPAIGRTAIASVAAGFYAEFPELVVRLDGIRAAGSKAIFLWNLTGTHSATGNKVDLPGWEEWTLSEDGLIVNSLGRFDATEYERQIAEGV